MTKILTHFNKFSKIDPTKQEPEIVSAPVKAAISASNKRKNRPEITLVKMPWLKDSD